jgi:hypothetical protein
MRDGGLVKLVASIAFVAGAACSYTPPSGVETTPDSSTTIDEDAGSDSGTSTIAPCATPDPSGLVLCLELEDGVEDGVLLDSSPGQHHATTSNLTPAMRTVPAMSPAGGVGPSSTIRVSEDPTFDRAAAYTLALWIRPDTLPQIGDVYGLIDHEEQFAMLIGRSPGGMLENRCVHTGVARFEWTERLPEAAWSFLACTWDGTTLCAQRWSSATDTEKFCHVPALPPTTNGNQGIAIGHLSSGGNAHSRFDGALDSIQIYSRALSTDQLCALIGREAGCIPCNAGC